MRKLLDYLWEMLRSPSSFRDDPLGYARNQFGHAYLIGGLCLVLPAWTVLPVYLMWEFVQWKNYDAELPDCVEDFGHVALVGLVFATGTWILLPAHAVLVLAGALYRRGE